MLGADAIIFILTSVKQCIGICGSRRSLIKSIDCLNDVSEGLIDTATSFFKAISRSLRDEMR